MESSDYNKSCANNNLNREMFPGGNNESFQPSRLSERIGDVTQIRLAGENADKVIAVLIESEGKKQELPLLLEEITENRQEVRDLLKTVAVEQKELADLYAKLAFQILNIDRTDTAETRVRYISIFRAFTNVLIALGEDPKGYLTSRITIEMLTKDWRDPVKSRNDLLYEIGESRSELAEDEKSTEGYFSEVARERLIFPLEKVFRRVQLVEETGENGDRSACVKVDFKISDAYSADLLMDSLGDQNFSLDRLNKLQAMASDIETFLNTFMAYKTNGMNDIQLSALRILFPKEYEAVRSSLLRQGVYDLALRGIDRQELREQGQGAKLSQVSTALGIHRFFVTGETGLVGDGLGTNNSLAPREMRFLKENTPYITARDYAEQWAWVLRVLALDGYVSRRKIPEKNGWFEANGNTVVLGLHGWSGSGEVMRNEVLLRLRQIRGEKAFWGQQVNHDTLCLIGWSMGGEAVVHLGRKLASQRLDVLRQQAGVKGYNDLPRDFLGEENLKKRIAIISLMRAAAGSCGFLHVTPAEAERKKYIKDAVEEVAKILASRATVDAGQIAHNLGLTKTELLQFVAKIYAGLIMNKDAPAVRKIAEEHALVFAREPESVALQKIGLIKYEGLNQTEIDTLKRALNAGFLYILDVWDKDDFLTRMADQEKNAIREGLGVPHFVMHNGYGHAICDPAMKELPVSAVCVWPDRFLRHAIFSMHNMAELIESEGLNGNYGDLPQKSELQISHLVINGVKEQNLPKFSKIDPHVLQQKLLAVYKFAIDHRVRGY